MPWLRSADDEDTLHLMDSESLDFRQLRHQTKNALQRIMCELASAGEHGGGDTVTRRLIAELERRVLLTAQISDALFGLSQSPGQIADRLRSLSAAMVDLLRAGNQMIDIDVLVGGRCPPTHESTIVRVAHEMIGNAIKHGMRGRTCGKIAVQLFATATATRLVVSDDGGGPAPNPHNDGTGQGMLLMRALARDLGGQVVLCRTGRLTQAEFTIPLNIPSTAALWQDASASWRRARPDLRVI